MREFKIGDRVIATEAEDGLKPRGTGTVVDLCPCPSEVGVLWDEYHEEMEGVNQSMNQYKSGHNWWLHPRKLRLQPMENI